MVLICLILNFTLSLNLQHIRDSTTRMLVNTLAGLFMSFYCYGFEVLLYIPYSLIGYFAMHFAPRDKVHTVTILITGLILTVTNLFEQLIDTVTLNVSTIAMMTFVKQMMITCNYSDGQFRKNFEKDRSKLTEREYRYSLAEIPSFLEYCSYFFNLQSSVIGPSFEFGDWIRFIKLEGE